MATEGLFFSQSMWVRRRGGCGMGCVGECEWADRSSLAVRAGRSLDLASPKGHVHNLRATN